MAASSRFVSFLRRDLTAILLAVGLFFLYYETAHLLTFTESDYGQHGFWALIMTREDILASFYNGSERLWHICVHYLMHLTHDLYAAAAIVTALADAAAYFLVFKIFDLALPEKLPRWLLSILLMAAFIASALTLPGGSFYGGRGGLSTWHNPTNIMVRPFAAAVFYMTLRIYDRRRYGEHRILPLADGQSGFTFTGGFWQQFREPVYTGAELVLYPLCLLLSVYAKPSFMQFFAPAIFLFLLIDTIRTRGMLLPFCLKLALAYLPAVYLILMALRGFFPHGFGLAASSAAASAAAAAPAGASEYSSEASGIAVYFIRPSFDGVGDLLLTVWHQLRYLLPCVFALFILVLGARRRSMSSMSRLALLCVAVAYLETWLFHETGNRASHGNFTWGMYLATWLAWTAAIGGYACLLTERGARRRPALYIGSLLLIWHVACGVGYLVTIFLTGDYYL